MAGRYAAPFSFAGSAERISRWPKSVSNDGWRALVWVLAVLLIGLAWAFVFSWYVIVFTVVGLWFIPYRLVRRGQRRRSDTAKAIRRSVD